MPSSRFLNPTSPGGLLMTVQGLLDANEELVIQSITTGQYFHFNETPTGDVNDINTDFVLSATPNPTSSLEVKLNGQVMTSGGVDYTLSGTTISFITAPPSGSILRVNFTVSPV